MKKVLFKEGESPLKNKKGEAYYGLIIKTVVVIALVVTAISVFSIFVKYQNANYICKRITREIELSGAAVPSDINSTFNALTSELGLENTSWSISNVTYFNNSEKTIQLRDTFKITVNTTYYIEVLDPLFDDAISVAIPMTATLTGMSEVFQK